MNRDRLEKYSLSAGDEIRPATAKRGHGDHDAAQSRRFRDARAVVDERPLRDPIHDLWQITPANPPGNQSTAGKVQSRRWMNHVRVTVIELLSGGTEEIKYGKRSTGLPSACIDHRLY